MNWLSSEFQKWSGANSADKPAHPSNAQASRGPSIAKLIHSSSPEVEAKRPLAVLIGDALLCLDLEIVSSSQMLCRSTLPLPLDKVPADPSIVVRVDEVRLGNGA